MTLLETLHRTKPHVHEEVKTGSLLQLAPRMAVDRDAYLALSACERKRLECIAVARSSYSAVLISKSAARLHDLWLLPTDSAKEPVELALPGRSLPRHNRNTPGRHYRKTTVGTPLSIDGARVVTMERAVVDVARYHGFHPGLIAADSALRMGTTKQALRDALASLGRVHGAAVVRRVIDAASSLPRSPYESSARALILDAGIAAVPRTHVAPGIEAELLVGGKIIIEVAHRGVFQRRAQRTEYLRALGFRVLQFTPEQLLAEPESLLKALRMVLRAKAQVA